MKSYLFLKVQIFEESGFFKLLLTGYLENITSDRKLIEHCSMRMDILYFIGFDIDEELPWHSTISRTRQLYPASLLKHYLTKCLPYVSTAVWYPVIHRRDYCF
ncbi:transposase [Desertivirga brevis]|uniref:transposase n=1 Tax=Desertivirga brevis TaxID=2810310 RepID=UPI001A975EFB